MTEPPEISIVIVNYNSAKYTSQCLDSIHLHPPTTSFEIVVVDNASRDGSDCLLEKQYPSIKLVRSVKNLGIAGGNNLGIRSGTGKYVLLLNNDTLVLPGAIDKGHHFLVEHPDAAGVGGNLLNPDGSYQSGPFEFSNLREEFLNLTRLGGFLRPCYPSLMPYKEKKTVDWISTAFMLFQRKALEDVGLVDEEYFIYSDETDLEYRMWKAGWKIYYLPDINTIHFGGKSLEPWRSRKLKYRGRLLFFRKHYSLSAEIVVRMLYAVSSLVKLAVWGGVQLMPNMRKRAKNELQSHRDILKMCLSPSIPPALA